MSYGQDGCARFAGRSVEQGADIQRFTLSPNVEAWRSEQVVQLHGEGETIRRRKERVDGEGADLLHGRSLDLLNQRSQIEAVAVSPAALEDLGNEDVLAGAHRVGSDAEECQQTRSGGTDAFAQ